MRIWSAAPDLRRGPPGPRERSEIVLGVSLLKAVTVPSSLVPWPALDRSAPRGSAVNPTDLLWSIFLKKPQESKMCREKKT